MAIEKTIRTAKEVLDDHLHLSKEGSVEEDVKRNYAEDVLILSSYGIYRGHKGLEELAEILQLELPDAIFEYNNILVEGEVGFLEWSGFSRNAQVKDGADSYVIRDGLIVAQTIHYTVTPKNNIDS
jgi:hypothetical protein